MHLVFTSVKKKSDANRMADALMKNELAACVTFWPVRSAYKWKGRMVKEKEFLLEIKTAHASRVRKWLEENHPYDVAMIYGIKADRVSSAYEKWVNGKRKARG